MKLFNAMTTAALMMSAMAFVAMMFLATPASAQGGPSPEARAVIQSLSDDERQKFFALSGPEKREFIQKKLAEKGGAASAPANRGERPSGPPTAGRPGGGGPPGGGRRGRPPTLVELGDVVRENLVQTVPITGRLVPDQRGTIASRITGRIATVSAKVGDRVEKGQVLAEIEPDRFQLEADLKGAEVLQARAKWNSAKAQVELLNQEMKRIEGLRRSAAFSQARYDDKRQEVVKAQSAVDETAAALRRARAARDLARIDVKDAQITAPFAGVVTNRNVSAGAFVNAGSPIASLLDDRNLEVEADIPSDRLSGIQPGQLIDVRLSDTVTIKAAIRAIVPDEDPLARTRAVRLTPEFGDKADLVVPNQSVVLAVPRGESRNVVTVSKDAIVTRQTGPIVFIFQDGRVRPAQVQIGEAFGNKFEIKSGLQPGMKIVVRGNELLRPGQPVRVARAGRPSGSDGGRPEGRNGGPPAGRSGGPGSGGPQAATGDGPSGPGAGGGGRGPSPEARAVIQGLSDEERQKFFALSRPERRAFIQEKLKQQ